MYNKIGFIGLGLIGGSLARTIRSHYPNISISAYDIDINNVSLAIKDGVCNKMVNSALELSDCNLIILATPVEHSINYIKAFASCDNFTGIITDVGSVKSPICMAVENIPNIDFIGGHPMAGSEKIGYESSKNNLFENVYYFLTPTTHTNIMAVDKLREFLSSLDTLPVIIDYNEHDKIVATISHLPHVVATTLVNMVRELDHYDTLKRFCAGGFKDITRISSSSPRLWSGICKDNSLQVVNCIDTYIENLKKFRQLLIEGKETTELFDEAKNYRDTLPQGNSGLISPAFIIYCDLNDEVGAIAKMANHLYMNEISIKNIAIENSREFTEGALRIELYNETQYELTKKVLKKYNYTIFR